MTSCLLLLPLAVMAGDPVEGSPTDPTRAPRIEFDREFAPSEGFIRPEEGPYRREICLDGAWRFQPVPLPASFRRGAGRPPELPPPRSDGWESTPVKVPSPWNVNAWGCGRRVGAGTDRPFWPDSVYFPSYPAAWDGVEIAWLRRTFTVPPEWRGLRIVLRFEAVAGACRVLVNGAPAGEHFDKYLPFELDVTSLVRLGDANELLVGVRAHSLYDVRSPRFPKMRAPYPCGSSTERIAGIWQDVFLLGLPPVRARDVFVRPAVDRDSLEIEVTVRNDGDREETVTVGAAIHPWVNLAPGDRLAGPEPRWRLDPAVLALPERKLAVPPGEAKIVLEARPGGRLAPWAPGTPNLYAAVISVSRGGEVLDRRSERFGWRRFAIDGRTLRLNGEPIRLQGDLLHPFGPFTMSRRYVWAWYRFILDFGGNCVRPHAQIHPRHYLDLADEMGLVVLDETAIFGSSVALNLEEPAAWTRFAEHFEGLVLRDRNHPSVLGWSVGNELFAVMELNAVPEETAEGWYRRFAELGLRARVLDPTRPWISCDGDGDLRGALPVWSAHFGHGTPLDRLPAIDKPLMVGESGGTYYARPRQLSEFNGPRAFESYAGRNEALAIDVYDAIVRMARPRLAYFSASETAWFGAEHLGFGYRDFSRLPGIADGVFFTKPFEEGRPGLQPERLPPYVATLNPGWDPGLPLYEPLAMFRAQKAALAKDGPEPCEWDHRRPPRPPAAPAARPSIEEVRLAGSRDGPLARRLTALGVPLRDSGGSFIILDGETAGVEEAWGALEGAREGGATVLVLLGSGAPRADLLPAPFRLTDRPATALVPDADHPWTSSFALPDLYFAEDGADRWILRRGLDGPAIEGGRVLLRASDTDWSLFNDAPEEAKCAALVLHEHLRKPSGAALVEIAHGRGKVAACTVDHRISSRAAMAFWRALFANMGVRLGPPGDAGSPAFDAEGVLVDALAIGRFPAPDAGAALATDFIGEAGARPRRGREAGGSRWSAVRSPSRERFVFREMDLSGKDRGPFAAYLGFWIRSPRSVEDLLAGGPDAPRVALRCYVSEKCRLFLDGREIAPSRSEPADYRTLVTFDGVPIRKGWNSLVLKVASGRLDGEEPATAAVRLGASSREFFGQLDSAADLPESLPDGGR